MQAAFLAGTIEDFDGEISIYWGTGRYKIDDDTYHREVKKKIISEFRNHNGNGDFTYKVKGKEQTRNYKVCGDNPDFEVDGKSGEVWPNVQKGDPKGLCSKVKLTILFETYIQVQILILCLTGYLHFRLA